MEMPNQFPRQDRPSEEISEDRENNAENATEITQESTGSGQLVSTIGDENPDLKKQILEQQKRQRENREGA